MKYVKPEFIVEEFMLNTAVAACDREWNGEVDTSWTAQPITCNRMGATTDYIFATGTTGCQYEPCHMAYIATGGTYTAAQLNTMGLAIANAGTNGGNGGHGSSSGGGSVTVPAGGGWVLCWENGNHYGLATPEIVKVMTSSY